MKSIRHTAYFQTFWNKAGWTIENTGGGKKRPAAYPTKTALCSGLTALVRTEPH
jgi:hypothetical protein